MTFNAIMTMPGFANYVREYRDPWAVCQNTTPGDEEMNVWLGLLQGNDIMQEQEGGRVLQFFRMKACARTAFHRTSGQKVGENGGGVQWKHGLPFNPHGIFIVQVAFQSLSHGNGFIYEGHRYMLHSCSEKSNNQKQGYLLLSVTVDQLSCKQNIVNCSSIKI